MIIVLLITVGLIVLYFTGNKSVHSEIIINTEPREVWEVLTNTASYPEWNPVMQLIKGSLVEGGRLTYQFTQDAQTSSEISATVMKITPAHLLNQRGGIPFILTYNHKYILEPKESYTRVTIHEDYRGIGVNFWNPKPVEQAYIKLNNALKERVERIANTK